MAIPLFFAMTAAELARTPLPPSPLAWMACRFAPDGGLTGLPPRLPEGSLVCLDDRFPLGAPDPELVAWQLADALEGAAGLLLDFQRPGVSEAAGLAAELGRRLAVPVIVSDLYAENLDGPVFRAPAPPDVALEAHLAPWRGREVWLDLAPAGQVVTVGPAGARTEALPPGSLPQGGRRDRRLLCSCRMELEEDAARFTLWRGRADLSELLEQARDLGVAAGVGLYKELQGLA